MKVIVKACTLALLLCPLLAQGQEEVGLLRIDPHNRKTLTHFGVWGGYEDGRFKSTDEALAEWKVGAEFRHIGQRKHTTWIGSVSFEQDFGKYQTSSLLMEPFHYPMDILDLTPGTKSRQDLRLEGGFLSDIDDIWAAGLRSSVWAEHASKRKETPWGNFGTEVELEPVVTFFVDDNVGVVASYRGRLRTENTSRKAPGEETGEDLFLDNGLRYVDLLAPGVNDAFSFLELAHGFTLKFHSPEESGGIDMLWKRGQASGNGNQYRFPGSTLHGYAQYIQPSENSSHQFRASYQRDRDQWRLVLPDGGISALSGRLNRNAELKYVIRFHKGLVKKIAFVLDGNQVTERAMREPSFYDKILRYDGTATILTSFSAGIIDLDFNMLAGKGWCKDPGVGDPAEMAGAPRRLMDIWLKQMDYLLATRVGLNGALTTHITHGLSVRIDAGWCRGLDVSLLGGTNREYVTLTIGYDY